MVDSARPQSIVELARDATQVQEPGRALRAISELRVRLDDLEQFQVEHALERRWSWMQIGRALGVTRQAAHKRHSGRLKRGIGGQRLTVTAEAQRAVARARAAATARGHRSVGAPHLLLALLDADAGRACEALLAVGVGEPEAEVELPPGRRRGSRAAQISPEVHRAFERSLAEALRSESDRIEPEHLLLALLRQPGGAAIRVLERAGANALAVEAALGRTVRRPA